jgi:hypothetical protein
MGKKYDGNVEIIAMSEIYKTIIGFYFVSEDHITQLSIVIYSKVVTERM